MLVLIFAATIMNILCNPCSAPTAHMHENRTFVLIAIENLSLIYLIEKDSVDVSVVCSFTKYLKS